MYEYIPVYKKAMKQENLADVRTLQITKRSERQLLEIVTLGTANTPLLIRKRSIRSERIRSESRDSISNSFNLKEKLKIGRLKYIR